MDGADATPTRDHMILGVFVVVYVGMLLGGLPSLRLDRTGIALLGAIVLLASGAISEEEALRGVDFPTLALLFGLMVISAQLRLGGFYTWVAQRLTSRETSPARLLAAVIVGAGLLSAVFSNDIVCLAMTPVLVDVCRRRGLDPFPFLIGLAAASNAGSAATLIGNPLCRLTALQASTATLMLDNAPSLDARSRYSEAGLLRPVGLKPP